jgi:hypothetical protein
MATGEDQPQTIVFHDSILLDRHSRLLGKDRKLRIRIAAVFPARLATQRIEGLVPRRRD